MQKYLNSYPIYWYNLEFAFRDQIQFNITVNLISLICIRFLRQKYNYWSKRGVPGPTPINSFMQTFGKLKSYVEIEWLRKYGNVYG